MLTGRGKPSHPLNQGDKMTELNYDEDLEIDPDALDVEILQQGSLAKKYIVALKEMSKLLAKADELVKTTRSDLIVKANEDPEGTCGKSKPNAADIEAYYRTNKKYIEAKESFLDLQSEVVFLEQMKNEICFSKKSRIESLIKLHGQNYFAGPSIPRDLSKEWENKQNQKEANSKVKIARKR